MSRVEIHYDLKKEYTQHQRTESDTFHIKSYNNWVKALVFNQYTKRNDSILDLCCGKGGDLYKWKNLNVKKVVGFDISGKSIEQAKERSKKIKMFNTEFYKSDLSTEEIQLNEKFNIISMQFALHYFFKDENSIKNVLQTIKNNISKDGYFICTFPDACILQNKGDHYNNIYSINFENPEFDKTYGVKYIFRLKDTIDCEEYIVDQNILNELANSFGLSLIVNKNISEFYDDCDKINDKLFNKMKVTITKDIQMDEYWEVIKLYKVCVFKNIN